MLGLLTLFPIISYAASQASTIATEVVESPRVAQVRLAELLAEADAIESVAASPRKRTITFVVVHAGTPRELVAHTTKSGTVDTLTIEAAPPEITTRLHGLDWLAEEMTHIAAVTRITADRAGAVTLTTDDGRRYLAIPSRGTAAPNVAAEARWAAAWSDADS